MSIFYSSKLKYKKLFRGQTGKRIGFNGTIVKVIIHWHVTATGTKEIMINDDSDDEDPEHILYFRKTNTSATDESSTEEFNGCWDVLASNIFITDAAHSYMFLELWYIDTKKNKNAEVKNEFDVRK